MFLKRLELAGFKSFADKTELEFVQGITAVVGPNGSGKSNISDGIRWVLGEQSAKSLRGGKMEDIIFAGSDARKAVNYGEVSLTLDNSDQALALEYNEVTVTRRIHRSGDSEYFINRQACRLRDITELFMDTGIGREAYSIIGQGRIEEILSTRSEDRRGIFEEASGIVKYKSRKKEAQKKLDETEQNLLRIHDLVSELEDQIEPLREQSEKALKFKTFKEELKTSEISMYVHQIEELHRAWKEAGDQYSSLESEQIELSAVVGRHDAHLEKHRLESRRLEEEVDALQQSLLHYSAEFEKSEGQGELLRERKRNLEQQREQLTRQLEAGGRKRTEKETELAGLQEKFRTVGGQLELAQQSLKLEEENLQGVSVGTSGELEERLKGELLDVLNQAAQARNDIRYLEQQIETAGRRLERLSEDQDKWQEQKAQLDEQRREMESRLQQAMQAVSEAREKYIRVSADLKNRQLLTEELTQSLRKWEQKRDAVASRRGAFMEMQNDYDGFQHGVKEVLKARGRRDGLRGIHGAVAELIKVPAEIELAVETALGGALQHIVVENETLGRQAISFLKLRQAGRATFLPLDVIRPRSMSQHEKNTVSGLSGFVGVAADLVRYDDQYDAIVSNLLGSVIIAKTLEEANAIAARNQYRFRVVTLEGDVVNAGGSMTGGSLQKKTTSLLGRQRQIDELEQEMQESERQVVDLREQLAKLREEGASRQQEQEELRQVGEQRRIDEQQIRAEIAQHGNAERNLESQQSVFAQDRDMHHAEIREHEAKKLELIAKGEALQEEIAALQEAIRQAEAARKANESAKEALQGQLTELKVTVATAAQEKELLQEQFRRLKAELEALRLEEEAARQSLVSVELELESNGRETTVQIENFNFNKMKKQECAEQMDIKRAARSEWLQKLELEENETREQRNRLKQVEDQMHQMEVRANRLDVELDNLLKKLSEEYELSFELAKERYPVPEDIVGMQNAVKELRRKIAQLGEVNLGAIEEFQRVNERFEFLSTQKADLMEAKATLYQVIHEIDSEMSKRFRVTFDAIREQFVDVFARLFGGGRADLILADPDKLLDTGIEIVAQPPGKKLQNLQLLSGGERALTAIALLFAILRIKPVPFCVLDEVEAALDEANVSRFAQYLREFSQETQFIVVTHRKGTMEEADVLYGVTMEEGGVSKLVSVRLDEEEAVVSA